MKKRRYTRYGLTAAVAASTMAVSLAPAAGALEFSPLGESGRTAPPQSKQCGRGNTQTRGWVSDQGGVFGARIAIDDNCVETTSEWVDRSKDASLFRVDPDPGSAYAAAVVYGNIIQSSQTLQDWFTIDIATLRYGHDRVWDGSNTRFKAGQRWKDPTSGNASWNHVSGSAFDYEDTSWATEASAAAHADFHSDFLWCNLQPGQNFSMKNTLTSRRDGSYQVKFTQSRKCSGTMMATAHKTSIVPGAWS